MKVWPTKPLGEVCKLVNGRAFKPNEWQDAGLPIIRIQNLNDPTKPFNYTTCALPEKFKVRHGDTLLSWSGTPGTSFGCFRWDGPEGWLNQHIFNVHLSKEILPAFFIHQVNSKLNELITKAHGGVGLQHVTKGALSSVPIAVPPLAEQERIVKLLDEADELRKLRAQADRRTGDLIPALFHEMFGDPETNPKRWPRGTLKSFSAKVRYGLGQPPEVDSGGVPMLRATNIKHGLISEEGLIRVRREAVPRSRNALLCADDVLVVRSGAYTGDAARVSERWVDSVAGYDLVISPKERFTGDFVAWFLLSRFVQERYFQGLKSRAAQPHLNSGQVSGTPFFCPPLPLQKEFAERVTEIRGLEAEQAASRRRLEDLFQSLLHRAFQGELT
ncbi:MAG TPA: restriction endonuclease subunit S [Patescibacteria group bacterium]|nr:restriction endonuclease subunit S [Patescibacteria group bacterium]